jgi:cytochrome b561
MKSSEDTKSTPDAFGPVAVFLHWFIAAGIVLSVAFGLISGYADTAEVTRATMEVHQTIGVTIFLLALARLIWRLTHPAPPLPGAMPRGQKIAAAVTHGTLYLILFAMPVTGYVGLAARGRPITVFGLFDLPNVVTRSLKTSASFQNVHDNLQYFLYALLIAHVGAALYHQFVIKDGLLRRMWPARGVTQA